MLYMLSLSRSQWES